LAIRLTTSERERTGVVRRATAARRRRATTEARTSVVWRGRRVPFARYERDAIPASATFEGPALLVEYSSTILVPPEWRGTVDHDGNLRLTR
jgi:N-methylhydantoinase A